MLLSAMGSGSSLGAIIGRTTAGRRGSGATAFGAARTSMTGLEVDPEMIVEGRRRLKHFERGTERPRLSGGMGNNGANGGFRCWKQ
jgi:hypothetical protein